MFCEVGKYQWQSDVQCVRMTITKIYHKDIANVPFRKRKNDVANVSHKQLIEGAFTFKLPVFNFFINVLITKSFGIHEASHIFFINVLITKCGFIFHLYRVKTGQTKAYAIDVKVDIRLEIQHSI